MDNKRYIVKIIRTDKHPIPNIKGEWSYLGRTYCCNNYFYMEPDKNIKYSPKSETYYKIYKNAYKTYKGAETGYKYFIGMDALMYTFETHEWQKECPKKGKKRTELALEQFDKVKELYNAEIMTVDEAWEDWLKAQKFREYCYKNIKMRQTEAGCFIVPHVF